MKATTRIILAKVKTLRKVGVTFLALIALGLLVAGVVAVHAQAGTGYDLTWNTVDNGGVTFASSGGASPLLSTGYTLGGTAGQPDAAVWSGEGGYTLAGGFWSAVSAGAAPNGGKVYLPVIVKDHS